MIYCIFGYNPITDELEYEFAIPDEMTKRILEIIGTDYDCVHDYNLTKLTLESIYYALVKFGFKINPDFEYQIGPIN
jgi:hypothetical protein